MYYIEIIFTKFHTKLISLKGPVLDHFPLFIQLVKNGLMLTFCLSNSQKYFTYITRNLISLCELDLLEIFWEFLIIARQVKRFVWPSFCYPHANGKQKTYAFSLLKMASC